MQKYDFEVGKWSYLRGELKQGGWYYYYIYALLVKSPLGTIALSASAAIMTLSFRSMKSPVRDIVVLLSPAILLLVIVSSQTGFNRYIRYVVPVLPFIYIFAGSAGTVFLGQRILPRIACSIAMFATVIDSLSVYPHSMSYFNLAAGGPIGGPRHLLDANIDWGQDLLELKRFVDQHPEATPLHLAYFGYVDPKATVGLDVDTIPRIRHGDQEQTELDLQPGWYAVSVNFVFAYRHSDTDMQQFACFQQFAPVAMAGYSIYIYHLAEDDVRAWQMRKKGNG
jgi:hypothetical protein